MIKQDYIFIHIKYDENGLSWFEDKTIGEIYRHADVTVKDVLVKGVLYKDVQLFGDSSCIESSSEEFLYGIYMGQVYKLFFFDEDDGDGSCYHMHNAGRMYGVKTLIAIEKYPVT